MEASHAKAPTNGGIAKLRSCEFTPYPVGATGWAYARALWDYSLWWTTAKVRVVLASQCGGVL